MPPAPKAKKPTRKGPAPKSGAGGSNSARLIGVGVAIAVLAALVVGAILLSGGDDEAAPNGPATGTTALIDGIPQDGTLLGNPDAEVVLLQYEDIQCPVCKRYTDAGFRTIVEEYVRPGDVRVDFRGLDFLGDDSTKALRVALAAARQDRAWQMVELLYANQGDENSGWVTDDLLRELAAQIEGLDADKMFADADSPEITTEIEEVAEEAVARQVQGTPWFFVKIGDAEPYEVQPTSLEGEAFRPILDDALSG
jgi:protein-disulfide isomerase